MCVCVGEDNKEIIEHSLLWLAGLSRGQRSSPPGPAVVTAPTSSPFLSPLFQPLLSLLWLQQFSPTVSRDDIQFSPR